MLSMVDPATGAMSTDMKNGNGAESLSLLNHMKEDPLKGYIVLKKPQT